MNNGRVNLFAPPSAGGEGTALKAGSAPASAFGYQTSSEVQFQSDMLRGNWEQNALSTAFFSQENLDRIQTAIRRSVYERSKPKGYVIDDQSVDELKMIMRGLFYQFAKNQPGNLQGQIEDLNGRVVEWCVPHILSAVDHHLYYLKDIDTLPVPLEQPVHLSRAGTRSKPLNPFRRIKSFRNITVSNTRNIPTMNKKLRSIINILREYLHLYDDLDNSSPFQDTYLILFTIFGENMSAHFRKIIDTAPSEGDKFKYKLDSYILRKYLHIFGEEESENPEEYVKKIISFIKWILEITADKIHRQSVRDEIKAYMKEFIGVCNTIFRLWNENLVFTLEFVPENIKEDPEVDELTALLSRL